jgi:hypothetical protein
MVDFLIHNQLSLAYIKWLFILGTPLLARCDRAISFHKIKEGERWENMCSQEPHMTFSLPDSQHENGHYSLMGSRNDESFVGWR